jgi:hypothetical protein
MVEWRKITRGHYLVEGSHVRRDHGYRKVVWAVTVDDRPLELNSPIGLFPTLGQAVDFIMERKGRT